LNARTFPRILVMSVALANASSAFAESEPPTDPKKTPEVPAATRLISPPSLPKRLFVAIGGGLAGATLGTIIGVGAGCTFESLGRTVSGPGAVPTCGWLAVVAAGMLAVPGIGFGTYLAGDAMAPGGTPGGVVLGMLVGIVGIIPGALATAGVLQLTNGEPAARPFALLALCLTSALPLLGAAVGYELSRPDVPPGKSGDGLSLSPLINVRSDGAVAGVSLRF
jgi:hypothetical protein